MNYRNIINKGSQILKQHDIITANIDAELLLSISLNKSREQLLLNLDAFGFDLQNSHIYPNVFH